MTQFIVFIGLSITSSWGNGHATTYRALARELSRLGHRVAFLEHDKPWYAAHRDLPNPPWCTTHVYPDVATLRACHRRLIREADVVIVGSYVPEGVAVGRWVQETAQGLVAFYDIDTPVTLEKLDRGEDDYLSPDLIPGYHLYLSFTGGPTLERLEREYGAPMARALYCSVDTELYFPEPAAIGWDLGYLGTHSDDRQPKLNELLVRPARALPQARFVVAGPQYPTTIVWPENVARIEHLAPFQHRGFYRAQRFTLNVTRRAMVERGWSPSVRLFEAAACGVPVISDWWLGLETLFEPGVELIAARSAVEVSLYLTELSERARRAIGEAARARVLANHTAVHRARELEGHLAEARGGRSDARRPDGSCKPTFLKAAVGDRRGQTARQT